jgi:hypothetical protein
MNIDPKLHVGAREYLRNTRDLYKKREYNNLMHLFSPDMKQEIVLNMSSIILRSVWFLKYLEDDENAIDGKACLVDLSLRMERAGYAPREKIPSAKLNVLMKGVAAKAGNILTHRATWGEDVIVTAPPLTR